MYRGIPAIGQDAGIEIYNRICVWQADLNTEFEKVVDPKLMALAKDLARRDGVAYPDDIVIGRAAEGALVADEWGQDSAPCSPITVTGRRKLVCMAVGPMFPAWVNYLADAALVLEIAETHSTNRANGPAGFAE